MAVKRRKPKADSLPSWVRVDRSKFRKVLEVPQGHVHLWNDKPLALGSGASIQAIKCVTCDGHYFSNRVVGEPMPAVVEALAEALEPHGGMARAPQEVIDTVRMALQIKWGRFLDHFSTIVSMISCDHGLVEPIDIVLALATEKVISHREAELREGMEVLAKTDPTAAEILESLPVFAGAHVVLDPVEATFVISDFDDEDKKVKREVHGFMQNNMWGAYEWQEGMWFVLHLPTMRRSVTTWDDEERARNAVEEYIDYGFPFEPWLVAVHEVIDSAARITRNPWELAEVTNPPKRPKKFFHVTLTADEPAILEEGLIPRLGPRSEKLEEPEPRVFLFGSQADMQHAHWIEDEFPEDEWLTYLMVEVPAGVDVFPTFADQEDSWEWYTRERIPPEGITVIDREGPVS